MRLVIGAEPAPEPSLTQVLPPSSVPQRPFWATPAITMFEQGLAETKPRLPHSDAMFARLPVELTHVAAGAVTMGAASAHMNVSDPPPPDPPAPPAPVDPPPPLPVAPPVPPLPAVPADPPPAPTEVPAVPCPPVPCPPVPVSELPAADVPDLSPAAPVLSPPEP